MGADLGGGCGEGSGTTETSSAVVLINTGALISNSRTGFGPHLKVEAERFRASFPFKPLKSESSAVDDICGEVDALLACRPYFALGGWLCDG